MTVAIGMAACGCSSFLDVKPDVKLVVPTTLEDCELLMSDYNTLNTGYPTIGEIGADDYYLTDQSWSALASADEKNGYVWLDIALILNTQWQNSYKVIFQANQVLTIMDGIARQAVEAGRYSQTKGTAHFYRAFAMHQLASVFALPYEVALAEQKIGLPIREKPNLDEKTVRSTLRDTYGTIIKDYRLAIAHLDPKIAVKGAPTRASAYAGLARLYLEIRDYSNAYSYADSALELNSQLLDFNTLNVNAALPIARFNKEVLFPAIGMTSTILSQGNAKIDADLYHSYNGNDLRKKVFFKANTGVNLGSYAFKGSYDNTASGLFVGLTTSEMLLTRAEAAVRTNNPVVAIQDLDALLKTRYATGTYVPEVFANEGQLLTSILRERRKELVFRGRRWADLRRLNFDNSTSTSVVRTVGGEGYSLEPKSLKYAVMIPQLVIDESGITQNAR